MGLDMYAFISKEKPASATPDALPDDAIKLHYWRKHPNLHGWMENLYREKGGVAEFNCTPVVLTGEDIDRLETAIRDRKLPQTGGFFSVARTAARSRTILNLSVKPGRR